MYPVICCPRLRCYPYKCHASEMVHTEGASEWNVVNLKVGVHVIGACRAICVFLVGRSRR